MNFTVSVSFRISIIWAELCRYKILKQITKTKILSQLGFSSKEIVIIRKLLTVLFLMCLHLWSWKSLLFPLPLYQHTLCILFLQDHANQLPLGTPEKLINSINKTTARKKNKKKSLPVHTLCCRARISFFFISSFCFSTINNGLLQRPESV